jgi:hypothetical protein
MYCKCTIYRARRDKEKAVMWCGGLELEALLEELAERGTLCDFSIQSYLEGIWKDLHVHPSSS